MPNTLTGADLLHNPHLNRGSAFPSPIAGRCASRAHLMVSYEALLLTIGRPVAAE